MTRRIAALDPGARASSLAILDADEAEDGTLLPPARLSVRPIACKTFPLGRRVDLPEPIVETKTRTDKITGEVTTRTFTRTWRWESSPAERRHHAREMFAFLSAHGVQELVIEQNPTVFGGVNAVATNLRDAAGPVEIIADRCEAAGIKVHEPYMPVGTWRTRVAGKAHATQPEAKEGVGRYLDPELPSAHLGSPNTEHEIDALGCLLGFLLPPLRDRPERKARLSRVRRSKMERSPYRKRAPGEKRYPSKEDPSYLRKLALDKANQHRKAVERRAAQGCICLAKRGHTLECQLARFKARQGAS
jgi:hypothetical protein